MRANADSRKGHTVWGCSARTYTVVCIHWQKLYHSSLSRQWYDCQDKRDGLYNLHKLGKFKIVKCLLIYKLCNLLNIQFGENWKIGKQLFGGRVRAFVFSPMNLYSHFVNSSSRIQVRYTRHRRRAFLMFLDFRNSLGVRNSLGGGIGAVAGQLFGGGQLLGGRVFPDPKINSLGGDTITIMRLCRK